jgi:hypothetical protein
MQMNQSMMGGYAASPTPVTTDLIQQVLIPSQISPLFSYIYVYSSFMLRALIFFLALYSSSSYGYWLVSLSPFL